MKGMATLRDSLRATDGRAPRTGVSEVCRSFLGVILLLLFFAPVPAGKAEELDRLLVAVNGRVVTRSDLELRRKLNMLLEPGALETAPSTGKEIDRLVEQELLRQELEIIPTVRPEEVEIDERIGVLKDGFAEIGGLPSLLGHLGLQEAELREYIALQISLEKFVSFRFRPFVTVTEDEIRAYFEAHLRPELMRVPGAVVPELAEVSGEIEQIIAEEKVNTSMDRWMAEVLNHSRIEHFGESGRETGEVRR